MNSHCVIVNVTSLTVMFNSIKSLWFHSDSDGIFKPLSLHLSLSVLSVSHSVESLKWRLWFCTQRFLTSNAIFTPPAPGCCSNQMILQMQDTMRWFGGKKMKNKNERFKQHYELLLAPDILKVLCM